MRPDGGYYEVELRRGADPGDLSRARDQIIAGGAKVEPQTESVTATLFVPDASIPALEQILSDYRNGALSDKGKPPNKAYVEPIKSIRRARLISFWTDTPSALPDDPHARMWWEIWCIRGTETATLEVLRGVNGVVASIDQWLHFPEVVVVPVLARRTEIEIALFACRGITELRRGSDTPTFFVEDVRDTQHEWAENLAERTVWPGLNVPRVCLLDTGVNRAHLLLEPALSEGDLQSASPDWVATDDRAGHGTQMAGLALHGDLFTALQDAGERRLSHRLELVRILPADGFPPNEPARLSSITSAAVSLAEIENPGAARAFCLAVTNEEVSGDRATAWSASIDRAAAGKMEAEENGAKRLFFISTGNVPPLLRADDFGADEDYPIEDPAQAWNAVTVGGYTDKQSIDEFGLDDYTPLAEVGDLSPFSRNSLAWRPSRTPVKPEIVMEAGNRARSTDGHDLVSTSSLELLTTGHDVARMPIVNFAATSAATALAARFAVRLTAEHPDYWPETIRALMVHSASWTAPMRRRLEDAPGVRERQRLARYFGYGVPNFEEARASARNHLALVVQQDIQPYRKGPDGVRMNECHYYPLPWPTDILEAYADQTFILKATLSYFIEPNPGRSAAIDPQNYQSFGLRFDLKRPTENEQEYRHAINAEEAAPALKRKRPGDEGWMFGSSSISAGSLHCDVWHGSGAQLAARNMICVKPVSGWWKFRTSKDVCERQARYSLIVTLISPGVDVDLHTPIVEEVAARIAVAAEVQVR